jgi:hypothetical protein
LKRFQDFSNVDLSHCSARLGREILSHVQAVQLFHCFDFIREDCFGNETLQALLLPASSQCFIQLNQRQQFILACLYN